MKKYFAKSKELLATGEDDDVIYACLELRKCLECYAYETLKFYLKEVPLKAVESWQPDKVVRELVAIDSTVNYTAVVTMRSADADEAGPPLFVGTDRRISPTICERSITRWAMFCMFQRSDNSNEALGPPKKRASAPTKSARLSPNSSSPALQPTLQKGYIILPVMIAVRR